MNNRKLAEKIFKKAREEHILPMIIKPPRMKNGELGLLAYLKYKQNGSSAGEISKELSVSTARIAFSLNTLESKGYIIRKLDSTDKRKVCVFLTSLGEEKIKLETNHIIDLLTHIIDTLGEDKLRDYFDTACIIKNTIKDYYKEDL